LGAHVPLAFLNIDFSAVVFINYPAAQGKAEAPTPFLGSETRIENVLNVLARNAFAVVGDGDPHQLFVGQIAGGNGDDAVLDFDRVHGVADQVLDHPSHQFAVDPYLGQFLHLQIDADFLTQMREPGGGGVGREAEYFVHVL